METISRRAMHILIDHISDDYMEDAYWILQQFAAKGANDAYLDNKKSKKRRK